MAKKNRILKKIILGIIGLLVLFILVLFVNYKIFEKNWSSVSLGKSIAYYSERRAALLVVDIQEGTTGNVSKSIFYKKNADSLIKRINHISDIFRNRNCLILYIRSEVSNPLINLLDNSYAKGSLGAEFDKRLKLDSGLEVVKIGNDSFINSNLDSILTRHEINDLYIIGLDAAYCINITSRAAKNRNYHITLIEEAILSESERAKDSMMVDFRNRGINILSIDSLNNVE
ncbi:MAG: isochorismatase family cysteine hydrolase [Cyclobacteriaceae bacterium]